MQAYLVKKDYEALASYLEQYCKQENVPKAEAIRRGILRLKDKPIKK